jgi:hypothetical protein
MHISGIWEEEYLPKDAKIFGTAADAFMKGLKKPANPF